MIETECMADSANRLIVADLYLDLYYHVSLVGFLYQVSKRSKVSMETLLPTLGNGSRYALSM